MAKSCELDISHISDKNNLNSTSICLVLVLSTTSHSPNKPSIQHSSYSTSFVCPGASGCVIRCTSAASFHINNTQWSMLHGGWDSWAWKWTEWAVLTHMYTCNNHTNIILTLSHMNTESHINLLMHEIPYKLGNTCYINYYYSFCCLEMNVFTWFFFRLECSSLLDYCHRHTYNELYTFSSQKSQISNKLICD